MNAAPTLKALIGARERLIATVIDRTGVDREDARDAVATAIAKVAVDGHNSYPWLWVIQTAVNRARDVKRRALVDSAAKEALVYGGALEHRDAAAKWEDFQQVEILERIVAELPARARQVFLLRALEGKGAALAWAAANGVPRRTVDHYLREATAYCFERLAYENGRAGRAKLRARWDKRRKKWVRVMEAQR